MLIWNTNLHFKFFIILKNAIAIVKIVPLLFAFTLMFFLRNLITFRGETSQGKTLIFVQFDPSFFAKLPKE
jgi:hypothetical protein